MTDTNSIVVTVDNIVQTQFQFPNMSVTYLYSVTIQGFTQTFGIEGETTFKQRHVHLVARPIYCLEYFIDVV